MFRNTDELNRWVARLQRKLDAMPLTRLDREELDEIVTVIVSLVQRELIAVTQPSPEGKTSEEG